MKKLIYLLTAALFAATACQTGLYDGRTTSVPPEPGTMVEVRFTVEYPDLSLNTRAAMAEDPIIDNLYIAIFGRSGSDAGFLQNWIPATIETIQHAGSANAVTYTAMLPLVDEGRIIHFIANPPADSNPPDMDYEYNILPNMVTTGSDGAYWQRIDLPGGIKAAKNATGDYILDDKGNYTVDENSITALKLVYLVRNYAKIKVEADPKAMFTVGDWTLINTPDRGSVAPYDISTGENKFSEAYMNIKDYDGAAKGAFYEALTSTYVGYSPAGTQINHTWPENPVYATSGGAQYMYERPVPQQYQTCIVAEIIWKSQADYEASLPQGETAGTVPFPGRTYWYKIEILDKEGEYMPILRNIQYTLELEGINEAGYGSAQLAFNGDFFGNISSSLETSTLNEISTGESRIYVDYMDQTFLGEETDQPLSYWFVPDETTGTKYTKSSGNVTISVTQKNVAGYNNPIQNLEVDYDTGLITFDLAERTSTLQKGIIRVQGKVEGKRALFREVTINVIGDLVFTDETDITKTPTQDVTDQEVEITIGLDPGLPASLFPIQVRIEAEQNSLSTTSPLLPVQNGPSAFSSKQGQRSFYYIYTIERSMYYHVDPVTREESYTTAFPISLYTTKNGGNSTKILLSDMRGYFDPPTELTLTIN